MSTFSLICPHVSLPVCLYLKRPREKEAIDVLMGWSVVLTGGAPSQHSLLGADVLLGWCGPLCRLPPYYTQNVQRVNMPSVYFFFTAALFYLSLVQYWHPFIKPNYCLYPVYTGSLIVSLVYCGRDLPLPTSLFWFLERSLVRPVFIYT